MMKVGRTKGKKPSERHVSTLDHDQLWWVAVNGSTVVASPLKGVRQCVPKPEWLVGFQSRAEQLEEQQYLLTQPIAKVNLRIRDYRYDFASGNIGVIWNDDPDPPVPGGSTVWGGNSAVLEIVRQATAEVEAMKGGA
jgi:hypothetical protein